MPPRSIAAAPVDVQGPWRTTLVASFGLLAAYVPVTAVITALPSIQRGLSASASSLQWVSDALVIPMATLTLSVGVFGDVHGRRKVFLAGLNHGGDSSVKYRVRSGGQLP